MPISPASQRSRSRRGDRPDDRRETMNEARTSRRWRARLAAVTLTAGLLTAAASVSAPAGTASAPAKAPVPRISDIGKYAVGTTTRTFVDSTRPTEGVAPNRTLFTAIYYPAQGQPTDQPVQNALPEIGRASCRE